jgi:hypothetical protein
MARRRRHGDTKFKRYPYGYPAESGFEGANRLLALGKTPIAAEWGGTAFDCIPDADLYITPDKPSA